MKPLTILFCAILLISSCKHESTETIVSDQLLFEKAKELNEFIWYKNNDSLFNKSSLSGHSQPFSRTRYNAMAAKSLDSDKKVKEGIVFEEEALIVKELYSSSNILELYAIQYKKTNHAFADEKGWVWAYIKSDGDVLVSAENKGESCTSCHSQPGNIDLTLMNLTHP